jgi:hypothetical protein
MRAHSLPTTCKANGINGYDDLHKPLIALLNACIANDDEALLLWSIRGVKTERCSGTAANTFRSAAKVMARSHDGLLCSAELQASHR